MPEEIDHWEHCCTRECVEEHIIHCSACTVTRRGEYYLCRAGAILNQKYLKDRMMTYAP